MRAQAVLGASSGHPGHTALLITTVPLASVIVMLKHDGHRLTQRFEWGGEPEDLEVGETLNIGWSCKHPGPYEYRVTAETTAGRISRLGRFSSVSPARCRWMKQREAAARERSARGYAEGLARERRELQEGVERFEHNCRVEGGTPIRLEGTGGESIPACRAPGGGLLPVPVQG